MKKSILQNSCLYLVMALCMMPYIASSQELSKSSRKESKKIERQKDYADLGRRLGNRRFIVEMEYLLQDQGNKMNVDPMLNYLLIDSSRCVLSSESENILILLKKHVSTLDGETASWKLSNNDKNFSYYIQYVMVTENGRYYVFLTVNSDRTVTGNLTSSDTKFSFYGKVVSL